MLIHTLSEVKQSELCGGYLYVRVPNGDDPKVARLSFDGAYVLAPGMFDSDSYDNSIELSGCFYGPLLLDGLSAQSLVPDIEGDCDE